MREKYTASPNFEHPLNTTNIIITFVKNIKHDEIINSNFKKNDITKNRTSQPSAEQQNPVT